MFEVSRCLIRIKYELKTVTLRHLDFVFDGTDSTYESCTLSIYMIRGKTYIR